MNTADQLLRKWEKQIGKIIGLRNEVHGMIEKCETNIIVISHKKMQSEISFSWEKNRNVSTPPLAGVPAKWRLSHVIVVVDKPAQKFHTDDASLPRSG